jgi:hypothetical protein
VTPVAYTLFDDLAHLPGRGKRLMTSVTTRVRNLKPRRENKKREPVEV